MYEAKDVEMLHTQFCRSILNVNKSTNLSGLYGELGKGHRLLRVGRHWIKLLTSNDSFIPKKIYLMLKMDVDNNKNYNSANWAFQIKCILDSIGLSNLWMQQFDIEIPFNLTKQR